MATFGEVVSIARALDHEAAWRDLAKRAEPNPFGEFEFVAPALAHFGGARVALVWEGPQRAELIAVVAVSSPLLWLGFVRVWRHEQAALGALLVDRANAGAALEGLKTAARAAYPFAAGLLIPRVAPDGPLADAASRFAHAARLNPFQRAGLEFAAADAPSGKRRKEWARLERRLAERGKLEAHVSTDWAGFRRFLELEAKGWKGERGTALSQDADRLAFAREMAAGFANMGRFAVHELTLDGVTLAAGLVLRSGRRAFFWKIAYDESFAAYSPGVLLTRAMTRQIAEGGEADLVDSCAAPDHPMIEHVWPGRLEFVDLALPFGDSLLFEPWLTLERAVPHLRERAKRALGRKRS